MQTLTDSSLIQPIQHTSRVSGLYKNRLDQDMCGASRAAVVRALICLSATWTSVFSENANHCIASVQPKYSKDLEQPKKLFQMLTNDQFVVETFTRLASSTFTVAAPKIPPGRQLRLPHQQIQWAIETPAGPTNLQRGHMSSPRSWSITTAMPSRLKTRRPWKVSASSPLWLKTNAIQPSSQWHSDIPGIAKKRRAPGTLARPRSLCGLVKAAKWTGYLTSPFHSNLHVRASFIITNMSLSVALQDGRWIIAQAMEK